MDNSLTSEYHVRLPMHPRAELEAVAVARRLMAEAGMDEAAMADVQMALIEAIINAIEHSASPTGHIDVYFNVTPPAFEVRIEDAGCGFNPAAIEPVDAVEKRRRGETRGWGLEIMHRTMDGVHVESGANGTTITMTKKR